MTCLLFIEKAWDKRKEHELCDPPAWQEEKEIAFGAKEKKKEI
jgi:hypothetical protein